MFVGHYAAALALRAKSPRTPFAALLVGIGWLDIVHGVFVLAGIEHVRPDRTAFLGYRLYDMPWSHSLVAAIAWSLAGAALFARRGRDVAIAVGLAVFSHFALDALVHEHDLPLAPGVPYAIGLNLWGISPLGAWIFEGLVVAGAAALYVRHEEFRRPWRVIAVLAVMHVSFLPGLNPLQLASRFFS